MKIRYTHLTSFTKVKIDIRIISLILLSISFQWVRSQSFVKKDSSDLIPFHAKVYYNDDPENMTQLSSKMDDHRQLTNPHSKFSDGVLFGSYGSTVLPFLFSNAFHKDLNLGKTQLNNYSWNEKNIPYYLINKPLSELDFIFFGNSNEEFKGFFSQNLSKQLNLGLGIRRSNNKGFFGRQENLHNNLYFQLTYQKQRLRSNLEFYYNELSQHENGGMTFSIYDSLSADQWQNASPTLTEAINRTKEFKVSWRNRILLVPTVNRDSNYIDSFFMKPIKSNLYIDVNTSYGSERMTYYDVLNSTNRNFYEVYSGDTIIKTLESRILNYRLQNQTTITYTLPRRFSLSGYSIMSNNSISLGKKTDSSSFFRNEVIAGIGGELTIFLPYKLQLKSMVYKPFLGYTNQDFLIRGELLKNIKKTEIRFKSQYSRQLPGYINTNMYASTIDTTMPLRTQNVFENSLSIHNRLQKLEMNVQSFLIEDFLLYDSVGRPNQVQNNFFQLSATKLWGYKFLYLPTSIYFQNSLFPRSFVRQTIGYRNKHFKDHLDLLLGFDILLNIEMPSMSYQPFLTESLYSSSATSSKFYPKVDFFATLKISKVYLSFVIDNFMSSYLKTGTNYSQNAPLTPSTFFLRSTWTFLE